MRSCSHLAERRVAHRMADAANQKLAHDAFRADIEIHNDRTASQPGAGLALFADLEGGARLAADRAGALGRPAEAIGAYAAERLLNDLRSGATLDHYAADQVVPLPLWRRAKAGFTCP
jgi:RNA 3'-terminal phosphate cyclase (ATP)